MCNEVPRQQYCSKIDGNENIWSFLLLILTISALVQIHKRRRIKPRRREPRYQLTLGRNSIPSCVNDILSHQMKWRYCTNEISDRLSFRFFSLIGIEELFADSQFHLWRVIVSGHHIRQSKIDLFLQDGARRSSRFGVFFSFITFILVHWRIIWSFLQTSDASAKHQIWPYGRHSFNRLPPSFIDISGKTKKLREKKRNTPPDIILWNISMPFQIETEMGNCSHLTHAWQDLKQANGYSSKRVEESTYDWIIYKTK